MKRYYSENGRKARGHSGIHHALYRQSSRPSGLSSPLNGVADVDLVLTTQEVVAMLKNAGIDFPSLDVEP